MKEFIKISDFLITLDRDNVFFLMDCNPLNPVYEDLIIEYVNIEEEVISRIEPAAFIKFGSMSEKSAGQMDASKACHTPVIYVLLTIGDDITELGSSYFSRGDYLLGMLVNAMADTYLFQMDTYVQSVIRESCLARQLGIAKRLEAPSNIPMSVQKDILDEIKEEVKLNIEVTEGFMFTTVKTMGYILVMTEDAEMNRAGHDCSTCSAKNCRMRKPE